MFYVLHFTRVECTKILAKSINLVHFIVFMKMVLCWIIAGLKQFCHLIHTGEENNLWLFKYSSTLPQPQAVGIKRSMQHIVRASNAGLHII